MSTPGFFDYALQDQGGKKSRKFLEDMKAYIPFEALEELLIEEGGIPSQTAGPCRKTTLSLFGTAWCFVFASMVRFK